MFISYFCWPLSRGNKIHLLALFKTHQGVCLFHKTPDLWFYRGLYVGLFLLYVTSTKYNSLIHAGRQILTSGCVWFTWLITTSFCLADLKALNQKKKTLWGGRSLGVVMRTACCSDLDSDRTRVFDLLKNFCTFARHGSSLWHRGPPGGDTGAGLR